MINTIENPADFNLCTQFFFNLDEQLWKLEETDPKTVKLINKAHGDVQLKLARARLKDSFKINIKKVAATNIFLNANGNVVIVGPTRPQGDPKWEKFPPNCAEFFRIRYINEQQSEEQLLTALASDNLVLEPPSRTAATISGKSVLCFSQIST